MPSERLRTAITILGCLAFALLGTTLVVTSSKHLSATVDEPTHVAAGLEWWQWSRYRLSRENPPLSRMAVGLGPYAAGYRLPWDETREARLYRKLLGPRSLGQEILYSSGRPERALALARLGTLPFFVVLLILAGVWGHALGGRWSALLAVGWIATMPPILAHAGLATTDVAAAVTLLAALGALVLWWKHPSAVHAAALGVAVGLAVGTKYSAMLFVPAAALTILGALLASRSRDPRPNRLALLTLIPAALLAAFLVWSMFRFSWGPPIEEPFSLGGFQACFPEGTPGRELAARALLTSQPAPEMLTGLVDLCSLTKASHQTYLLGQSQPGGFWSFYPVALAVKTPLPFLAFSILAGAIWIGVSIRRRDGLGLAPAAAIPAILLIAVFSRINLGVRHVLAVYPLLALVASAGAVYWIQAARGRRRILGIAAIALALLVQTASAIRTHPYHLSYFNLLAGPDPAAVLADSDLAWGQGVVALEEFFRDRQADRLHIAYYGGASLCEHDLPPLVALNAGQPVTGWVAVTEQLYRGAVLRDYDDPCNRVHTGRFDGLPQEQRYGWLDSHSPVAILADSIRVYYIPEPTNTESISADPEEVGGR